jgi:hypothetical protein
MDKEVVIRSYIHLAGNTTRVSAPLAESSCWAVGEAGRAIVSGLLSVHVFKEISLCIAIRRGVGPSAEVGAPEGGFRGRGWCGMHRRLSGILFKCGREAQSDSNCTRLEPTRVVGVVFCLRSACEGHQARSKSFRRLFSSPRNHWSCRAVSSRLQTRSLVDRWQLHGSRPCTPPHWPIE